MHWSDGFFRLRLSDGSALSARRAVIALGLKGYEQTPPVLQGLPEPYVVHSGEVGSLTWARGKAVVIVGGGQSALGLAALLNETGARVEVLVRDGAVSWNGKPDMSRGVVSRLLRPEGGLGPGWRSHILSELPFVFHMLSDARRKRIVDTSWGPSGAWWLRDRVVGKVNILLETEVSSAALNGDHVCLNIANKNGTSGIRADHVIVATGFKVDMRRHAFFSDSIKESLSLAGGAPVLTDNFETSIPGLYVIGPASAQSFGPVMRFIYGAKYAAPRVARHIMGALRQDMKSRIDLPVATSSQRIVTQSSDGPPAQGVSQHWQKRD